MPPRMAHPISPQHEVSKKGVAVIADSFFMWLQKVLFILVTLNVVNAMPPKLHRPQSVMSPQ